MKKNWFLLGAVVLLLVSALLIVNSARESPAPQESSRSATPLPTAHHQPHTAATAAETMPAYLEIAPSKSSLGPTLAPEKFTGPTREAYRAVREIPVTIAQLPCYCHCDKGFGHKSLYSCFEDDHASHCAVCVNEALLALRLERNEKLTPAQIRERIVAEYAH